MSKVVTHFSNANTFGMDRNDKISGFQGVELSDLTSTGRVLTVPNAANGGVLAAHITDAMTHSIRVESVNGTAYYLMATTTVTNRS